MQPVSILDPKFSATFTGQLNWSNKHCLFLVEAKFSTWKWQVASHLVAKFEKNLRAKPNMCNVHLPLLAGCYFHVCLWRGHSYYLLVAAVNETKEQTLPGKAFVDRFLDLRWDGLRLSDLGWEFHHGGGHLLSRWQNMLVNLVRAEPSGTLGC